MVPEGILALRRYIHKFACMKKIVFTIAVFAVICCGQRPEANVKTEAEAETETAVMTETGMENKPITEIPRMEIVSNDTLGLNIYYPDFERVDLVCGKMPSSEDPTVIFCCEAAFTGQLLEEFKHGNIAGDHVSGGEYFKGYKCKPNTGIFISTAQEWGFFLNDHKAELKRAAESGGMGFEQNMVIFNGIVQPFFRKAGSSFEYRTLCELDGRLCIIDSKKVVRYDEYVRALSKLGVKYALYLDMGAGWNYSYYRTNDGSLHTLHLPPAQSHDYRTNWLTFYKSI